MKTSLLLFLIGFFTTFSNYAYADISPLISNGKNPLFGKSQARNSPILCDVIQKDYTYKMLKIPVTDIYRTRFNVKVAVNGQHNEVAAFPSYAVDVVCYDSKIKH